MNTKKENQLHKQKTIAQARKRLELVLKNVSEGKAIEIERTGLQSYHGVITPYNGNREEYGEMIRAALDSEARNLRRGQGLSVRIRNYF